MKQYRVTDPSFGDDVQVTFDEFVDGLRVAGYKFAECIEAIRHGNDVIVVDGKIAAYEIEDYKNAKTIYSE